jgi:hypothetical protein
MSIQRWSIEAEKVRVVLQFPVNEESPKRMMMHIASETFSSSVQEYFDTPASLEEIGSMFFMAASEMRKKTA